MRIDICGRAVAAVPQPFLNVFHRNSALEQKACTGMSQFVKGNLPQAVIPQKQLEMLRHIVGFERLSKIIHVNIVALKIAITAKLPAGILMFPHPQQQLAVLRN